MDPSSCGAGVSCGWHWESRRLACGLHRENNYPGYRRRRRLPGGFVGCPVKKLREDGPRAADYQFLIFNFSFCIDNDLDGGVALAADVEAGIEFALDAYTLEVEEFSLALQVHSYVGYA